MKGVLKVFIVLFLTVVMFNTASATIPTNERNALIDLYNSTNGPGWYNSTNWLGPVGTECTWYGVSCNIPGSNVEGIGFTTNNNLSGTIPVSIGNFPELIGLHFYGNENLTGQIPSTIGNLAKLQSLEIAHTQISGTIPKEIGNLSNLYGLGLYGNQLTGEIPAEFINLTNLQGLDLSSNQLTGSIPPALGNMVNLISLWLSSNQFTGTIPSELGNLINLSGLYLSGNQLTGPIPPELGNLTNLVQLFLDGNQLTGPIPTTFENLTKLTYLALSRNQLSGGIPKELGYLPNLQTLLLDDNPLGSTIPPELGNLSNLTGLSLKNTQLTGSIPPELGSLTKLGHLNLSYNELTGSIPSSLGNLTNMYQLFFDHNQLTGSIPSELSNMTILYWLRLDYNALSGSIPSWIENLTNLYLLTMSYNALTGPIPSELGNLVNLRILRFDSNALAGDIPSTILNLTKLINNNSDFRYNGIYTTNPILQDFLNSKQLDNNFESTQTVAPTNLASGAPTSTSIPLTWTAIPYNFDPGGYEVYYATTSGGPYTLFETTANKSIINSTVTGLNPSTTYFFRLRTVTYSHSNNQNTIYSEYTGEISATTTGGPVLNPDIDVFPTSLAFGDVIVGNSRIFDVTVFNLGDADLVINDISLAGSTDYSMTNTCPLTLTPGDFCTIIVTFTPSSAGTKSGALTINSNDPDESVLNVSLEGNGLAPDINVSPASLDFGDIMIGDSASGDVTVNNNGNADLTITLINITGTDAGDFSQTNNCVTVPAGNSCTVTVTFAPSATGLKSATLSIESNDPDTPMVNISLTGNGIAGTATVWHTETVDSIGDVGYFPSLSLNSAGLPHITYFDWTSNSVKYAYYDGTNWNISVIDSTFWSAHPSSELDASGNLHLSYLDRNRNSLKYAKYNGISLYTTIIEPENAVGFFTSIALDASGYPHISYLDAYRNDLKYAFFDGTYWHKEIVDPSGYVMNTAIALDPSGNPHISYYEANNNVLKYAYHDGSSWLIQNIESGIPMRNSIATDSNSYPHISYSDPFGNLKYTHYNGSSWFIETVDSAGTVGGFMSIAIDSSNLPHISYYRGGRLTYAYHDGSNWLFETVDSAAFVGYHSSLVLDSSGNPRIGYLDISNKDLKYAYRSDMTITEHVTVPTSSGDVGVAISEGNFSTPPEIVEPGPGIPDGYQTPYGGISFSISTEPGQTVTIVFTFPGDIPKGSKMFKCHNGACSEITGATISGNIATFDITDGGYLDQDGIANGQIIDPCVLAIPESVTEPVPDIDVSPENADFGDVLVGTSISLDVTVFNFGDADLEIQEISITGSSDFIQTNTCPAVLSSGGSCSITVTFSPSAIGTASGTLTITSNDPDEQTVDIPLTGNGISEPTVMVTVDIKPGSYPNSINPRSRGKIPVAILTTDTFDASTVNPMTVLFGVTGTEAFPVHSALSDVDSDGDKDLILHFRTQDTGITCGVVSSTITGKTFSGQAITGSDSIKTVGCR